MIVDPAIDRTTGRGQLTLHMAASTEASGAPRSSMPLVMYAIDSAVYAVRVMRANFSCIKKDRVPRNFELNLS